MVREALARATWGRNALSGTHDPKQVDASPLARCAAAALYARDDLRLASSLGADVARVTHQAPLLVDACRVFTCMISAAISGRSREQVLAVAGEMKGMPLKDEVLRLAAGWGRPPDPAHRPPAGILRVLDRVAREFARGESFAGRPGAAGGQPGDRPGCHLRGLWRAGRRGAGGAGHSDRSYRTAWRVGPRWKHWPNACTGATDPP